MVGTVFTHPGWLASILVAAVGACGFTGPATSPGDGSVRDGNGQKRDGNGGGGGADSSSGGGPDSMTPSCPSSYTITVASSASQYRVVTTNAPWWDHQATCQADLPGMTHLVVFDSVAEQTEVSSQLAAIASPPTSGWYAVGAVQTMNQPNPGAGWRWLTGGPVATAWATGKPDDGGGGGETNQRNLAAIAPALGLLDIQTQWFSPAVGAICECDGRATDGTVASQIPSDPT